MEATTSQSPQSAQPHGMTRTVEEELISQASAGITQLPMLDIIFSRMAVSLVSTFKTKAAFLCDIGFSSVEYMAWEDVVADVDNIASRDLYNRVPRARTHSHTHYYHYQPDP